MSRTLNEPIRPLSSDDLIYTITACNSAVTFAIQDIVTIQWQNTTTGEMGEDSYYLSQDATVNEAPLNPLILMLTRSVGCLSTIEISCQQRFIGGNDGGDGSSETQELILEFKSVDLQTEKCTPMETEHHASKRQIAGNRHYGEGSYTKAIRSYSTALKILDVLPTRVDGIAFKCLNNLAACHMQQDDYDEALAVLQRVELVDPNNVKMLWRSGRALLQKHKYDASLDYLSRACNLDPNSTVVKRDLKKAEVGVAEQRQIEKELYKKMVSGMMGSGSELAAAEISAVEPEVEPVVESEQVQLDEPFTEPQNNTQMSIDTGVVVETSTAVDEEVAVEISNPAISRPDADTSFNFAEPEEASAPEKSESESESTTTEALMADRLNDTESFDNDTQPSADYDHGATEEATFGAGELVEDLPTPVQSVGISSTIALGDISRAPEKEVAEKSHSEMESVDEHVVASRMAVIDSTPTDELQTPLECAVAPSTSESAQPPATLVNEDTSERVVDDLPETRPAQIESAKDEVTASMAPTFEEITNRNSRIEEQKSSSSRDSAIEQTDDGLQDSDGTKQGVKCRALDRDDETMPVISKPKQQQDEDTPITAMVEPTQMSSTQKSSKAKLPRNSSQVVPASIMENKMLIAGGMAIGFIAVLVAYFS